MKSNVKQSNNRAAFTIVELLTVMSIIVILIGLLVPALNQVKRYAYGVKQMAQLKSIDTAIELFNSEFDGYPDSSARGPDDVPYCGAMKLCEAAMGQDLMGFHQDSIFRADGTDGFKPLYPDVNTAPLPYQNSLSMRRGPYLPPENANAYRLADLYATTTPFNPRHFVLCDVFRRVTHRTTGKKVGMPILYYRANTSNTNHNVAMPGDPQNIYNYQDNQQLLVLGKPWDQGGTTSTPHRLAVETGKQQGVRFYMNTKNEKVTTASRPYRADTYILISAGWDGEYGTPDDICNFEWRYKE
ncbi:MAG TPA: type II secretion system protein, partial [Sedimentisphaerales bacterium]|nr:type II secretion system protein [Sedimentisphaerales bacterium]